MSNLDFDARYETSRRSTEEIDTLGNSMNVLSERLKTTIGELKEANAQLKKDIDEKVQIDEMRKEFIANVSHELKTPIALIRGAMRKDSSRAWRRTRRTAIITAALSWTRLGK